MINLCFIWDLPGCSCCLWPYLCFPRAAAAPTQLHLQPPQVEVLAWAALCEYRGVQDVTRRCVAHHGVRAITLVLVAPKGENFSPCVHLVHFNWTTEKFYLCVWFFAVFWSSFYTEIGLLYSRKLSPSSTVVCTDWACGCYSHRVYPVLRSNWLS